MTYGYIGLGAMGGALARRITLTHDLIVFDLDGDAVHGLEHAGAQAAATPGELASACDIVVLCLPTSDHVRSAIFGDGGLLAHLRRDSVIVDQTSGDPRATREMAAQLEAHGIDLVDAPVSGGPAGAEAGTIAIMVGGSDEQVGRVRPLLEAISPNIFHAGGTGAGHTMKLVNNLMSGAQRLLTFEAVALAARNGLEPRTVVEILKKSGGRNAYVERVMLPQVIEGRLDIGFTLALAHKDVRLACELGSSLGVPMFYGDLTRSFYQMSINSEGADAQVDTAALLFDEMARTSIVGSGRSQDADGGAGS